MKIFDWMQNKLNGRQGTKKPNSISVKDHGRRVQQKEEFSDWPDGLLAIGTFGNADNNSMKEDSKQIHVEENQNQQQELTPDEVQKLQHELNLLLHKQDGADNDDPESETCNDVLDKFLHSHPSLGCDKTNTSDDKDSYPQGDNRVVVSRGKDNCPENTKSAIKKKSLSFLLKKMFIFRSGSITPTPSLRSQVPESRIEKILRAILHKKIYPQNTTSPALSTKKYLENKQKHNLGDEDELNEKDEKGIKWVKTDSEYIVLEI